MKQPGRKHKPVIASVTAEMVPFAKTGGLADVTGTLPAKLAELGHSCYSFLPAYRSVKREWFPWAARVTEVSVPIEGKRETAGVWRYEERRGHTVFFIEFDRYFDREQLYGTSVADYPDNGERFAFFSRAVLEALLRLPVKMPDIVHAHDWHAALVPVYLKERYPYEPRFSAVRTLLSIHNLAYQGVFDQDILAAIDLDERMLDKDKMEFWGRVNFLKGGLNYADALNTVSATYAREIQGTECGAGLDGVLRKRSNVLNGIVNGLDTDEWNPKQDTHLRKTYSGESLAGKVHNKKRLQEQSRLAAVDRMLLMGMVTRLVDQKGIDILMEALPGLLKLPVQLVVLGAGEKKYEEKLGDFERAFTGQVSLALGFDNELAHRIYAGSDVFLMPSRFEPCGLGQLIGFRYGTVPIVRRTGGLNDTVKDVTEDPAGGTGFVFSEYSAAAFIEAVGRAVTLYRDKTKWKRLTKRIMKLDYSWAHSVTEYTALYTEIQHKEVVNA